MECAESTPAAASVAAFAEAAVAVLGGGDDLLDHRCIPHHSSCSPEASKPPQCSPPPPAAVQQDPAKSELASSDMRGLVAEEDKGKSRGPIPAAPSAAVVASVLGNSDLLREILLRLECTTCLVRAAAVSKRWLRHASVPAFRSRFRRLHPHLGFYIHTFGLPQLRFMPLPQTRKAAAVLHRGSFELGDDVKDVSDCRNGCFLVNLFDGFAVLSPQHPELGATFIPPLQIHGALHNLTCYKVMLQEHHGDAMSHDVLAVRHDEGRAWVHLYNTQAGAWECCTSDSIEVPEDTMGLWRRGQNFYLLADGKLYLICEARHIVVLDLTLMSWFRIKLPDKIVYEYDSILWLSRAESPGFYLIHVEDFQINVWLHRKGSSNTDNWKLVDRICLRRVFGQLANPNWYSWGSDPVVDVAAVGDNADFMFLKIEHEVFYLHVCSRKLEKVYKLTDGDRFLCGVYPLMMDWPINFPILNDVLHDQD